MPFPFERFLFEIIKRTAEHNHPSNPHLVQACKMRSVLKRRYADGDEEPVDPIYDDPQSVSADVQQSVRIMSSNETLDSMLQRVERKLLNGSSLSPAQMQNQGKRMTNWFKKFVFDSSSTLFYVSLILEVKF